MGNTVKHVAIILDGNRRFAKKKMLQPWKGHEFGAEKVDELIEYSQELGITQLTLYCFSTENLNRPEKEIRYLFNIGEKWFTKLDKDKLMENKIKVNFIGDLDLVSESLRKVCKELQDLTLENSRFIINFALAYGGRQEIVNCVKKLINSNIDSSKIREKNISDNLFLSDEPDIIIRTGGEKRTSNFLLWQSAYSEWFFLDKLWPEFEKQDLITCIDEFKQRKRNFGK